MPAFQVMCSLANEAFSHSRIDSVDPESFAPGRSLPDIMDSLHLVPQRGYLRYLSNWPTSLQEALRASILDALNRKPRVPIHFAWAPAYDYSVRIWEAHSTADSSAAITILLESPYPGEGSTPAS